MGPLHTNKARSTSPATADASDRSAQPHVSGVESRGDATAGRVPVKSRFWDAPHIGPLPGKAPQPFSPDTGNFHRGGGS